VKPTRFGPPSQRIQTSLIPFVIHLLDKVRPHALLIPKVGLGGVRRSDKVIEVLRALAAEAGRRDVPVYRFSNRDVKLAFRCNDGRPAKNKAVINQVIVERYEELRTSMPKVRRPYHPEQYFTPLFSAVALFWAWQDLIERQRQ
jgi:hypothetical protein